MLITYLICGIEAGQLLARIAFRNKIILPATNPNGSDLNAQAAARQIRLDRI